MSKSPISRTLGLVTLGLIASSLAMAQDSGWYLGGSVGRSKANIDNQRIASSLTYGGLATPTIHNNDHNTGYKVFGGYQFNRYLALEGGYFNLGKMDFTANTMPGGTLDGSLKTQGLNLDLVGILPFTSKFSAFARAGVIRARTSDAFSGTGSVGVVDPSPIAKRAWNAKAGVGLQYQITKAFGLRAELERYRVTDAINIRGDLDLLSAGFVIRFGRRAAMTSSPSPVAAMPPQAPVIEPPMLVVVPVADKTQEYCSILDLQFRIDSDEIQREDREKLAVVGTFLTKYPDSNAVIEGHSDNVGDAQHNLDLSQRRAQSVVDYLVSNQRITASRLKAVGYGDSRPIADNGTEEGKRQNRRIDAVIACVTDIEGLVVKPARATMALFIDYDRNKADVDPKYDTDLRRVATFLKANPGTTATVEGHTGNLQGNPQKAMEISQLRAQNVVNYLVDKCGIDRSRLAARGFGQERRFAYNTSPEGQKENRRINIIINYPTM